MPTAGDRQWIGCTADRVAAAAGIEENERISGEFRRELLAACTKDALGDAMERLA
jgi:hypothetical protein